MEKKKNHNAKMSASVVLGWIFGALLVLSGCIQLFSHPVSGVFAVLSGLVIFPPVWNIAKKKWNFSIPGIYRMIAFIVLLAINSSISAHDQYLAPATSTTNAEITNTSATTDTPITQKPLSPEDNIKTLLINNLQNAEVKEVKIDDAVNIDTNAAIPEQKNVNITLTTHAALGDMDVAKRDGWRAATEIIKDIFPTDQNIYSVTLTVNVPRTDVYGKTVDAWLETIIVTRTTFTKIDFANFSYLDIPSVSDVYSENHTL